MRDFFSPEARARIATDSEHADVALSENSVPGVVQVPARSARARGDDESYPQVPGLSESIISREVSGLMRGRKFGQELRSLQTVVPNANGSRVYFLQGPNGYIKIGVTANLASRLSSHRTSAPDAELLLDIPGDRSLEARLHKYFASYRYSGEWFKPCEELLQVIREPSRFFLFEEQRESEIERLVAPLAKRTEWRPTPPTEEVIAKKERLDTIRATLGMSKRELARALGVPWSTYQKWADARALNMHPSDAALELAESFLDHTSQALFSRRAVAALKSNHKLRSGLILDWARCTGCSRVFFGGAIKAHKHCEPADVLVEMDEAAP